MRVPRLFPLLLIALLCSSCGAGHELKSCQDTANRFMELMARGDVRGAYGLCEPSVLNYDGLRDITNNAKNDPVWNDYKGLDFGEGGQRTESNGVVEIRLAPATPTGHDAYVTHFAFRQTDQGWRIIGFKIALKADE